MGKDLKGKELGRGISQRKDGVYQARYIDRFGKRQYIYKRKLGELRIALVEALNDDKVDGKSLREPITLDDWFAKWLKLFKTNLNESTVWIYSGYYYKRISPILGKQQIAKIDELHVRELLTQLKEDGYAHSSRVKVRKIISQMYESAIDNHYAAVNPAKKIKIPKDMTAKPVHALTQQEQKTFLEFAKGRFYYNAYLFQLYTGVRPGELFALKTGNVDFKEKTISINKTLLYKKGEGEKCGYIFHEPKTAASKRKIPMSKACEQVIKRQLAQKAELQIQHKQHDKDFADLLFPTSTNTPMNTSCYNSSIQKTIKAIRASGNDIKDFSGHDLRHTFATRCFESGIEPKTIQEYMGHGNLQMTMDLYTHVFQEHKSKEIDKLDKLNQSMMAV